VGVSAVHTPARRDSDGCLRRIGAPDGLGLRASNYILRKEPSAGTNSSPARLTLQICGSFGLVWKFSSVKALREQDVTGSIELTIEAGRKPQFGLMLDF
jgi:hypothetical protein